MKRNSIVACFAALVLMGVAAPALAGGPWDMDNSGQHDPGLGALVLANGIASTDLLFAVCGWSTGEWGPLRERAVEVAPQLFQKAGLPPEELAAAMRRDRDNWLRDPLLPRTCAAPHAREKRLRWARDLVDWATSPVAP